MGMNDNAGTQNLPHRRCEYRNEFVVSLLFLVVVRTSLPAAAKIGL
jgi:hypothetical protein